MLSAVPGEQAMLDEVLNQIGRRQKFILTSHARPDGDAVGSTLACCQILRSMGKQAIVVLSDGVPGVYSPLPFADSVLQDAGQVPEAEAVIILECDSVLALASPGWSSTTSSTSITTPPRVPSPT